MTILFFFFLDNKELPWLDNIRSLIFWTFCLLQYHSYISIWSVFATWAQDFWGLFFIVMRLSLVLKLPACKATNAVWWLSIVVNPLTLSPFLFIVGNHVFVRFALSRRTSCTVIGTKVATSYHFYFGKAFKAKTHTFLSKYFSYLNSLYAVLWESMHWHWSWLSRYN